MVNRRALFAVSCVSLFTFGIVLTTLGALLPSIIERFGIDKAAAGSLFLLNTFGIVIGSVVFGPIVDRNGYKEMLVGATVLIIVGVGGDRVRPLDDMASRGRVAHRIRWRNHQRWRERARR